jgi:hypothetical protein
MATEKAPKAKKTDYTVAQLQSKELLDRAAEAGATFKYDAGKIMKALNCSFRHATVLIFQLESRDAAGKGRKAA